MKISCILASGVVFLLVLLPWASGGGTASKEDAAEKAGKTPPKIPSKKTPTTRAAADATAAQVNIAYHLAGDPRLRLVVKITEAELDKDFARIKELGFTHVTLWPGVAISKGSKAERLTRLAVRKAAKHGLKCYIWFWTSGKPLMYKHKFWKKNSPPMVDRNGRSVSYMNIWDERWRKGFLRRYLRYLGRTFSKYPNVEGYLIDEPAGSWWKWKQYGYDKQTQRQFVAQLRKKYRTLGALNAAWGKNYRLWRRVAAPRVAPSASQIADPDSTAGAAWRDWTSARQQFFIDWFADVGRYLKKSHRGCKIIWSITARYVDNSRARELADCLDWKRIMPHVDTVLMAKFPGKDAQAVRFAGDVMDGLARKPEMKDVGKIFAIVIWRTNWVEKPRPQTLRKMLELARKKGFGVYVWAWQGKDHLEAWDDLQEVFKEFTAASKEKHTETTEK